jgi:hypothetical protein
MLFLIIAVLVVLGILFLLTFLRFMSGLDPARRTWTPFQVRQYAGWLGDGVRGLISAETPGRALAFMKSWLAVNYPGWRQWAFWALALSFGLCAASGFVFALFVGRGLFGLPLLAHVMSGALFALSLPAVLLLRARAFRPDAGPGTEAFNLGPLVQVVPKQTLLTALFWAFAASGLALIVTALASMLPYFYFRAQFPLLEFHRYAALAGLAAAAGLFDFGILTRRA